MFEEVFQKLQTHTHTPNLGANNKTLLAMNEFRPFSLKDLSLRLNNIE